VDKPLLGIDASSAQGAVDWTEVAKSTQFGWEKVTQGTDYLNPFWANSRTEMLALQKKRSAFVPGAFMFLTEGNAAAQVDYFVEKAGDLTEFLIAIDAEPTTGSNPTSTDVVDAVARFRYHYPKHLLGGYCPKWYWGAQSLAKFDWLWASEYLTTSGTPASLYPQVPAGWWADYGNCPVKMLQFTDKASVPGATGEVDCSAFTGTLAQLKGLIAVPTVPPVAPRTVTTVTTVLASYGLALDAEKAVVLPVPSSATKVTLYADPGASNGIPPEIRIGVRPDWRTTNLRPIWDAPAVWPLPSGSTAVTLLRRDKGAVPVTVSFE
jgi:GH25 family lysozyme M1 (1,4-beta-N-acetylmuramidase)